jgi:ribosomal protein S12 methylthiotransferase accessory factor
MTLEAATVSAIGEAVERYSASMPDSRRIVWSRPAELVGKALDPNAFALYGKSQYARRDFPFARFDPEVAHPWVEGEWLVDGAPVWVPAVMAYLALDVGRQHVFCQGTSNGLAAGTDRSEAAIRAILELLERDAFMTSWRARRPGQRVRLDRTLDPDLRAIVDGINSLGARFELVILPSLGGHPTAVSLAFGNGIEWPGVTLGLATDPDPRVAIRQAILELGQTGPYLRRLMREGNLAAPARAKDVKEMIDHARYYFSPDRATALDYLWHTSNTCSLADLSQRSERSLDALASGLVAAGARVALVDVTSPDTATHPLWVMRAVSPDLQPISFGYGLERLSVPRLAAICTASNEHRIAPIW